MKSSSEKINISGSDISKLLDGFDIYIPDILESNYEYSEEEKNDSIVASSVAYGTNKNDAGYLENVVLVFVIDNECNGIAITEYELPIVGIYTGSISKIKHNANLLIGTIYEEDFDVSRYESERIEKDDKGVLTFSGENNLLGVRDERILSFFLSELALRFLVLHEIGHHVKNHVAQGNIRFASYPSATVKENESDAASEDASDEEIEIDEVEMEADMWAASKIAEEFDLLINGLTKNQPYLEGLEISSPFAIKLCALQIIVYAITLAFSTLFSRNDMSSKSASSNFKLKQIAYREISALFTIIVGLHERCRDDFVSYFNEHSEEEKAEIIQNHNGIDIGRMDLNDFAMYISKLYTDGKRVYCKVNGVSDDIGYLQRYHDAFSAFHHDSV